MRRKTSTTETVDELRVDRVEPGERARLWVETVRGPTGDSVRIPVIVLRGMRRGPVVGFTGAIHGNELNGLPIIHRLLAEIDPDVLSGTVVGVPVVNVPGFLANRREFSDGEDLNRVMPGREGGTPSQAYAHCVMERIVSRFEVLVDLHTASTGRINSLYVRADLTDPSARELAHLPQPQIVVHNRGADGTLRGTAQARGIRAITVEIGDPQRFQAGLVGVTTRGLKSVLAHLGMIEITEAPAKGEPPVVCGRSYWITTDTGGLLEVFPPVAARVTPGQAIARVTNLFGDVVAEYLAPEDGIVVGKSSNPVAQTGDRVLHLGIIGAPEPGAR